MVPLQLLRQGNSFGLMRLLGETPEAERSALVRPLCATAKAISNAAIGEESAAWEGPIFEGHLRAALLVEFPTAGHAIKRVPRMREFVEREMAELFIDRLDEIAVAWGEKFLKNPRHHDAVGAMQGIWDWILAGRVEIEFTQGLTLLLLTSGLDSGAALLMRTEYGGDEFTHALFQAAFTHPGIKGASLQQRDSGSAFPERGIGNFVVPELIRTGVLSANEVFEWCTAAIADDARSEYDKRWFKKVRGIVEPLKTDTIEELILGFEQAHAGDAKPGFEPGATKYHQGALAAFIGLADNGGLCGAIENVTYCLDWSEMEPIMQAFEASGNPGFAERLREATAYVQKVNTPGYREGVAPGSEEEQLIEELWELYDQNYELQQFDIDAIIANWP